MKPRDTTQEAHEHQLAIYRRMSGEEKMLLALEMSEATREITLSGIRARHPEYSPVQARDALLRLLLGDELFKAAYPSRELLQP